MTEARLKTGGIWEEGEGDTWADNVGLGQDWSWRGTAAPGPTAFHTKLALSHHIYAPRPHTPPLITDLYYRKTKPENLALKQSVPNCRFEVRE